MSGLLELDGEVVRWFAGMPGWVTAVAELVTHLASGGGVWLLAAIGLMAFGRGLNRRTGIALGAGLLTHLIVIEGALKHLVARQRPFVTLGLHLQDRLLDPNTYSFPSGHSTASFLGAWVLGARFPRYRWPLIVVAALIATSRVAVAAHYPTDLLSGAVLGVLLGAAFVHWLKIAVEPSTPAVENGTHGT